MSGKKYEPGFVLYAGWCVKDAGKYIKKNELTVDDVKIVRYGEQIIVKVK